MPVENHQNKSERMTDSETILRLKNEILSAWEQLPLENQATIALALANEVMDSPWRDWLIESIPHTPEKANDAPIFPIYSLSAANLEHAFNEEELAQLNDQDIRQIVEEMRTGFLYDSGFWYAVRMIGQRIIEDR